MDVDSQIIQDLSKNVILNESKKENDITELAKQSIRTKVLGNVTHAPVSTAVKNENLDVNDNEKDFSVTETAEDKVSLVMKNVFHLHAISFIDIFVPIQRKLKLRQKHLENTAQTIFHVFAKLYVCKLKSL